MPLHPDSVRVERSARFPFRIGDRITSNQLASCGMVIITAIGHERFLGRTYGCIDRYDDGFEEVFDIKPEPFEFNRWRRVEVES